MSINMISSQEIQFIADIIRDLKALADPSEYLESEVHEALRLLGSLESMPIWQYLELNNNLDRNNLNE